MQWPSPFYATIYILMQLYRLFKIINNLKILISVWLQHPNVVSTDLFMPPWVIHSLINRCFLVMPVTVSD